MRRDPPESIDAKSADGREGLADAEDRPTAEHFTLYRRWSEGGIGTSVTGNVMVDRRYLERPGNVVVEDESVADVLSEWVRAGASAGNHLWMQINHPGRQCTRFVTSRPVAPSAVQLELGGLFAKPRVLAVDEIVDIIGRFAGAWPESRKEQVFRPVQIQQRSRLPEQPPFRRGPIVERTNGAELSKIEPDSSARRCVRYAERSGRTIRLP